MTPPRARSIVVVVVGLAIVACTTKRSPEGPPEVYPQIQVNVDNLWADEGAYRSVHVGADGSFVRTDHWSNGSTDYETVCTGVLPAELVEPWLGPIEAAATSPSSVAFEIVEDRHPSPHFRVTVGWARSRGAVTYADPQAWASELGPWLSGLANAEGECQPDREL